ncbi:hypothetical protein IWW55_004335 [Coemansia sp. RSA 2706]|nr:hypothetical protein IWW55_004335 [Coemansia sp. RSA 2706]
MNFLPVLVLLGAAASASAASSSSASNGASSASVPDGGCPVAEPTPITCDDGQDSVYIPQTSAQCAHYMCPAAAAGDSNDSSGSSKTQSVVLPAVLGTIIPLIAIGVGVFLYLHYRRRNRRSVESHRSDGKYMSGYNNLEEGSVQSPGVFSSTYSASKWRESVFQEPGTEGSRASIPIIFSADYSQRPSEDNRETKLYSTAEGAPYRETRLYNAASASEEARKWAAPNVVNMPQMPQMPQKVVVNSSGLEINTADVRNKAPEPDADALSPDTPESPGITQLSSPVTTQLPRIVQVGKPQIIRAIEAESNLEQMSPGSPLRVADNGWDSDSDIDVDVDSPDSRPSSFSKGVLQAADAIVKDNQPKST